jgi:heme exporter protein A
VLCKKFAKACVRQSKTIIGENQGMLQADQVICQRGLKPLFMPVNFTLQQGQCLWLRGANGSGKTTLLRALSGLTQPTRGQVKWQTQALHANSAHFESYCAQMLYLGHLNAVKDELTPLENLRQLAPTASSDQALLALTELGLQAKKQLACKHLSQGQKRRVALARLCISHQSLWLLDEPFVALDDAALLWLQQKMQQHVQAGGLLVFSSHQTMDLKLDTLIDLELLPYQPSKQQSKAKHA